MAYDAEFKDGFDCYGPPGAVDFGASLLLANWWSSFVITAGGGFGGFQQFVAGLIGPGYALQMGSGWNGLGGESHYGKVLPANYARTIGGVWISDNQFAGLAGRFYIAFIDGGVTQVMISFNNDGTISVMNNAGTVFTGGTTTTSRSAGSTHHVGWDITFHASAGIIKIAVDGVLTNINLTGLNTANSGNAYINRLNLGCTGFNSGSAGAGVVTWDHFFSWYYTAAGGPDTLPLTSPIIETQFGSSDSAVAFTPNVGVLGQAYRTTSNTNAPGANQLALRPFTPAVNGTLNSVAFIPAATSAGANFKPVIYSDSAGAPNALLSTGAQVTGATSGTTLTLPLTTPQALTAGTQYWIGYITDTSVVIQQAATTTLGYKAANTYGSGAPGTAPAMTSLQPSWMIWGNLTGLAHNFAEVAQNPPLTTLSYVSSGNVGDEDLYNFPPLSSTPTAIYSVGVRAYVAKTDAGTRTVNLRTKSGGSTGSGGTTGQAATTSFGFLGSDFAVDPATGVAFTPTGLNAATSGLKIAS